MKRWIVAVAIYVCLAVGVAWGNPLGSPIGADSIGGSPISEGYGESPISEQWWVSNLTFYAPFDDPDNPLRLIKGTGTLSFTRIHDATHTATYVHPETGLVTVADNNGLRIEAGGALIEGAKTNLLTYSEAFTGWVLADGGSITADTTIAPDGNTTAATLTDNTSGAGTELRTSAAVSANSPYTASTYIKKTTGATTRPIFEVYYTGGVAVYAQVAVNTNTGVVTVNPSYVPDAYSSASVGDYWRVSVTKTSGVASTTGVWSLYPAAATMVDPSYDPALTGTINIWGGQLEAGNLSSYIPTIATAMVRNPDVLMVPVAGILDNVAGTLAMTWTPTWASTAAVGTPVLWDAGGLKATYTATNDMLNFTDGTNTISTAALTFSANVAQKLAFRWGPGGLDIYRNGAEAATGATYTAFSVNANLYIGSDVSSANQAYSNFENVRAWNRELSDAEMVGITQ